MSTKVFTQRSSSSPDIFTIGDLNFIVPPDNIEIARHENYQVVSYLRDAHAMRINSGRSAIRVDITFITPVDEGYFSQLQRLVAMTRITPFVPVRNEYLKNQIRIFDELPKIKNDMVELHSEDTTPRSAEFIPMAIMGLSVNMGGDAPDFAECRMTLLYSNHYPFSGNEANPWNRVARDNLKVDYSKYLSENIVNAKASDSYDQTIFKWWDVKLYSELVSMYKSELLQGRSESEAEEPKEPKKIKAPKLLSSRNRPDAPPFDLIGSRDIISEKDGRPYIPQSFANKNEFYRHISTRLNVPNLLEAISNIESGGLDKPYQAINTTRPRGGIPTYAAGKWQIKRSTFNGLFFDGSEVGVPLRNLLRDDEVWAKYGNDDPILKQMVFEHGTTNADGWKETKSDNEAGRRAFADWYASPGMEGLQTFVTEQYVKSLLKKHNGDGVSVIFDYWLGDKPSRPYIAEWEAAKVIRGFTLKDGKIADINAGTALYFERAFSSFITDKSGWELNRQLDPYDSRNPGEYELTPHFDYEPFNKGGVPLNRYGETIYTQKPTVSEKDHYILGELGWKQLAELEGSPNPNIKNPLFYRLAPNLIDFTSGPLFSGHNNAVTAITISFQNKFAMLPIVGWPYPAMQSMGSLDSEIRIACSSLSNDQNYDEIQASQDMLHTMASRARRYRASIVDASEINRLNSVQIQNKLINDLGIRDIVVTDVNTSTDFESPNLVRLEIIASENAVDLNRENLRSSFTKNDSGFKQALRNGWLKQANTSAEPIIADLHKKLNRLQELNDTARLENLADLEGGRGIEQAIIDYNEFLENHYKSKIIAPIGGLIDSGSSKKIINKEKNPARVHLKVPPIIKPGLKNVIENINKLVPYGVLQNVNTELPFFADLNLEIGLLGEISNWLNRFDEKTGTLEESFLTTGYLDGEARYLLETNQGKKLREIWAKLKATEDQASKNILYKDFYKIWAEALYEWYNENIIELLLVELYQSFPDDPSFASFTEGYEKRFSNNRGCYRDLLLADTPWINPYAWIDEGVEPGIKDLLKTLVESSSNKIDNLLASLKNKRISSKVDSGSIDEISNVVWTAYQPGTSPNSLGIDAIVESTNNGVDSMMKHSSTSILANLNSLKEISISQFTMRKAFPAYKLYFIEEDNQGIVYRFDDFYSYNAIVDLNLIKYKYRPDVLAVTLTNLFGYLDSKTFNDTMSAVDRKRLIKENKTAPKYTSTTTEYKGVEKQINIDGSKTPLKEIMLLPGTKILLKMGYDNDPDKLETVFAGQITEISGGEVMTIICQDWATELFASAGPDEGIETKRGPLKRIFFQNRNLDLQGNISNYILLQNIATHRNAIHFGQYKLGDPDPNHFGYRRSSGFLTKLVNDFTGQSLKTRALENIYVESTPYLTAFGIDNRVQVITDEELAGMTLWELLQMIRVRSANHIAAVRPYGQGDATLYFGPPHGLIKTKEFGIFNNRRAANAINQDNFEEFVRIIKESDTIPINNFTSSLTNDIAGPIIDRIISSLGLTGLKDSSVARQEIPIWFALVATAPELFFAADGTATESLGLDIAESVLSFGEIFRTNGLSESNAEAALISRIALTISNPSLSLGPSAPEDVIRKYWDAIIRAQNNGGFRISDQTDAVLFQIIAGIRQRMKVREYEKAISENKIEDSTYRPFRKWHIVTDKHHIISNNITLNNNFANEVRAHDKALKYDPELVDVRARYFDFEIPKSIKGVELSYMLAGLLADEVRTMYTGELILTGTPEIRPHDILLIFDDVRHIHGAVEVAKVNHIFNQDMGFISIITPHAIVEIADFSLSVALTSFYQAIDDDLKEASGTRAGTLISAFNSVFGYTKQAVGIFAAPGNPTGQHETLGAFMLAQAVAGKHARSHPLTIAPLVKRGAPWLAGLEGADGRGLFGAWGNTVDKGFEAVSAIVRSLRRGVVTTEKITGSLLDTYND